MRNLRFVVLVLLQLEAAFIGSALWSAAAHATTEVKQQWVNPEREAVPLQDVVVMALIQYPGLQRVIEDEVVSGLRAHGVTALPGYRSVEQDAHADTNDARQVVTRSGASVVLVIRMVNPEQPGTGIHPQTNSAGNEFYDWLNSRVESPSSYREFMSEARLFDVTHSRWIWAGTFETRDAGLSAAKTSRECTEELVKALEGHKLLKPHS